jgi:hypothetical protein
MSIGPLGTIGSLAATPLPQRVAEVDKAERETTDRARAAQGERAAEAAAGIGETEEDSQASERDADGRRLWEAPPAKVSAEETSAVDASPQLSKDPSGESGSELDLVG